MVQEWRADKRACGGRRLITVQSDVDDDDDGKQLRSGGEKRHELK